MGCVLNGMCIKWDAMFREVMFRDVHAWIKHSIGKNIHFETQHYSDAM